MKLTLPFSTDYVVNSDGEEIELTNPMITGGMLAARASVDTITQTKVVSVRMDIDLFGFLDFVVERANGKFSRNELIIQLIRSGVAASWAEMSDLEKEQLLEDLKDKKIEVEFPSSN